MSVMWKYLDKRSATIAAIKDRDSMKFIVDHTDEEITAERDKMAGIGAVQTLPPYRRRGIGFDLVTAMLGLMKKGGVRSVLLEVRESNLPAQNCYARAGFTVVGRRKNYYELPKEDALLMGRELV